MLAEINMKSYLTCPLPPTEVETLEEAIGGRIPYGFRSFLLQVGIPQSLVSTVIQDERSLIAHQSRWESDGFVFASPGEALLIETPRGEIVEFEYGERRTACGTFSAFLEDNIAAPHDPNALCWTIQLSFATHDQERVIRTLWKRLGYSFDLPWGEVRTSAAGVTSYRTHCTRCSTIQLKRLEYPAWNSQSSSSTRKSANPRSYASRGTYQRGVRRRLDLSS